jgi:hypothetical protein
MDKLLFATLARLFNAQKEKSTKFKDSHAGTSVLRCFTAVEHTCMKQIYGALAAS